MQHIILSLLFAVSVLICTAQDSYINNRKTWQFGYSKIKVYDYRFVNDKTILENNYKSKKSGVLKETINTYSILYNKGISNNFEMSIGIDIWKINYDGGVAVFPLPRYEQKFHLMPLFVKNKDFRFDVYIPFGFIFSPTYDRDSWCKFALFTGYYSLGIGGSAFLFNSIGIYAELSKRLEDYRSYSKPYLEVGLIFKKKKR